MVTKRATPDMRLPADVVHHSSTKWRSGNRRGQGAPHLSDEEIVRGLEAGEAWASQALYERTFAVVLSALQRALGERPDDQDDLVQLAYERLIRSLRRGTYQGRAALTSWACIIADRVAIDAIRSRVKDRRMHHWLAPDAPELVEYPAPQGFERGVEQRADAIRMLLALQHIKPEHARAVELHDVMGLDLEELASVTGVTVAAAQSRLVRGRRELARTLKQRYKRPRN
jgi:RNA polymerase sigma-70 factor (ECF subfamily)